MSMLARCHTICGRRAVWCMVGAAILLTVLGIEAIGTVERAYASRQTVWFVVGLLFAGLCLLPQPRVVGLSSYGLLALSLLLLAVLIFPGVPQSIVPLVRGTTRSWINLHFMRLQPSELAKVTFVMAMAWYLRHRSSYRTVRGLLLPLGLAVVPVLLILKQPDLGTALLFGPTIVAMLVAAGARLRHIAVLATSSLLVIILLVGAIYFAPAVADTVLRPHQQNRFRAIISVVTGDDRYNDSIGFQQVKSKQLIGAGRVYGYGADWASMLISRNRLPETQHDMIFTVIANRWGLVGCLTVLILYMTVVLSAGAMAASSKDPFARLAIVGFAAMLFVQGAIHIAVNIGLLPVTGITLPFVSYGGSSLAAAFAMVGLAVNFGTQASLVPSRPTFEFSHGAT